MLVNLFRYFRVVVLLKSIDVGGIVRLFLIQLNQQFDIFQSTRSIIMTDARTRCRPSVDKTKIKRVVAFEVRPIQEARGSVIMSPSKVLQILRVESRDSLNVGGSNYYQWHCTFTAMFLKFARTSRRYSARFLPMTQENSDSSLYSLSTRIPGAILPAITPAVRFPFVFDTKSLIVWCAKGHV
jgi:hypothetical protein